MRLLPALALITLLQVTTVPFAASAEDDELVLLPAQGELRAHGKTGKGKTEKLKPGAGLFLSFDANEDGRVDDEELHAGITAAYASADTNSDGELTPLEQQTWAESLPTRDDSLANAARFDPNLDRIVSFEEFQGVIINLAADYREDGVADIVIASLTAPEEKEDRRLVNIFEGDIQGRGGMTPRD